ncbi:MAG: sodium:solute symporter family protein, partial [Rickettsiaceae bacterium]|nr:sodium:solute symporter family protein [Rickettsiaceae bacterium]
LDLNKNLWILTATIFASAVGGGAIFGLTEKIYNGHIGYCYGLLLTIPIDLLIAKFLVPRLHHYKSATSIGDIIGAHYGKVPRIISGLSAALISIGYLSAQISVSSVIFSSILKIDGIYGILASYAITITYASFGGLRAIVLNNVVQFIAMILAIPSLSFFSIYYISTHNIVTFDVISHYSNNTWTDTSIAFTSFAVMGLYPTLIQRILVGRSSVIITRAIYLKSLIYFIFITFIAMNGILGLILVPDSSASLALTNLIDLVMPEGFKGFIAIGLLASVMSTADSDLNVASISLVNDVIKPIVPKNSKIISRINLIFLAKLSSIMIGATSILLVMKFKTIIDIIIFAAGLWVPVTVIPLIGILYGVALTDFAFCISAVVGIICFLLAEAFLTPYIFSGIFIAFAISCIIFLLMWKVGWAQQFSKKI